MISKVKKAIAVSAISTFLFVPAVHAEDSNQASIYINDNKTEIKGNIVSGRTLVPLRSICEKLGSTVLWDASEKKITVVKAEKKVEMKLGEYKVDINGHEKSIDVPPQVIGDATYVPVRFLSENIGYDVAYDNKTKIIRVDTAKENPIIIENKREVKKGDVEVDIQYPQITGMYNNSVQDKINNVFKKHVDNFKLETKDYDKEVKELRKEGFKSNYGVIINYEIKYNKNDLLSIVFTNYNYTGGAHGNYENYSYTFNLITGDEYDLNDLFSASADYKTSINKYVKEQFNNKYNFSDFKSISDNQKFYLSDEGIVVYFGLYEYTCYAAGIPEFTIRYDYETIPYILNLDNLKKDYVNVLNNKNLNDVAVTTIKDVKADKALELDIRYPQLNGLKNKEAEAKINTKIKEYAEKYKKTTLEHYTTISKDLAEQSSAKYLIGLDYKIKYNFNNIISLVFTEYLYSGGAHGNSDLRTFTMDMDTGTEYELNDLFKDGTDYVKEIDKLVKQKISLHENKDSINFESIKKSEGYMKNFYLNTDGSLVIFFQHYDIAPYALGILDFGMPGSDIQNIAKDWVVKDITDYSLNDCFGMKNGVQQKRIMDNLNALVKNNISARDLATFINNNIACISRENASGLILALEDVQKKDLSKCSEKMDPNEIQQEMIKEFKFDFDMSKINSIKDGELKAVLTDIRDNGYKVFETEGMYSLLIDYSRYLDVCEYVTDDIGEYIKIMAEESSKISHDDAALTITWDEVYKRYCSQESFINLYPASARVKEIKEIYNWYVRDYIYGADNTPAFDIYTTNKLKNELLESYKKAAGDNSKSKISEALKDYLNVLEKNGYVLNEQVEKSRKNILEKLKM